MKMTILLQYVYSVYINYYFKPVTDQNPTDNLLVTVSNNVWIVKSKGKYC